MLKESAKTWHHQLTMYLKGKGYVQSKNAPCAYSKKGVVVLMNVLIGG